jgi:hypothetical protein
VRSELKSSECASESVPIQCVVLIATMTKNSDDQKTGLERESRTVVGSRFGNCELLLAQLLTIFATAGWGAGPWRKFVVAETNDGVIA